MLKKEIHFKKPRGYWWDVWSAGAIAQILYNFFSMQLYHYYIYFYIVGIILLADALIGWGRLNADGIKIRLGLGFRNTLYFKWQDIIKVEIRNIKKTSTISSGGLSNIPFIHSDCVRALVLTFNLPFNCDLKSKIDTIKKFSMFKDKIDCDDQENELIVFEKPDGGFRKVVTAIKIYASPELKIDIEKNKNDSFGMITNRYFALLIDVFVIAFTIGTILYYNRG